MMLNWDKLEAEFREDLKSETVTSSLKSSLALLDTSSLFHSLLRHILTNILKTDYEIFEYSTPDSFLAALPEHPFQILIADIQLIENVKNFAQTVKKENPEIHIMAFTSINCKATLYTTLQSGFNSYLLKESDIDQIVFAVKHFMAGGAYIDPKITHLLIESINESVDYKGLPYFEKVLTPREKEICGYACKGLTNKEIAQTLAISKSTVDNHFINLYRKLGITRRTQLLAFQADQQRQYNKIRRKKPMSEFIKQRTIIYDFLAQVFMEPIPVPGDTYAKTILANVSAFLKAADDKDHEGSKLLQSFLNSCLLLAPPKVQEKIAIDRTFLCRGTDQNTGPLPPYEAFYSNELKGQNIIFDLLSFYQKNGFVINESIKERPDYIGIELAFMSELCHKELAASTNSAELTNIIRQEQEFFTNHLEKWLPEYCRQIAACAKTDFFKGIALYLLDFLEDEKRYLAEAA